MKTKLFAALFLLGAVIARGDDNDVPHILTSPDKQHAVQITDTALPGSDPDTGDSTIAVLAGKRAISKFPTEGYLIDAFWSPDGKYVGVNNRRANSGDYAWVFSLKDGRALKKPSDQTAIDASSDLYGKAVDKIVKRVHAKFPGKKWGDYERTLTRVIGWEAGGRLRINTVIGFEHLDGSFVSIDDIYTVDDKGLSLVEENMNLVPQSK